MIDNRHNFRLLEIILCILLATVGDDSTPHGCHRRKSETSLVAQ